MAKSLTTWPCIPERREGPERALTEFALRELTPSAQEVT